jgi:hypothetical protein
MGDVTARLVNILTAADKMKQVEETVEKGVGNLELCIKEVEVICKDMFHIMGKSLEQELLRFIDMIRAAGSSGGVGCGHGKYVKGIMEHKVIQTLRAVSVDRSLSRQ